MTTRRPPSTCPVCSEDLITTRLGCPGCGTELVGTFSRCSYCSLADDELEILRVFLTSRGNLRELEKHLGVSYPTARARFNSLLVKLGLDATDDADGEEADETVDESAPLGAAAGSDPGDPGPMETDGAASAAPGTVRDQVLAQVAAGALAPDVAADLLRRLT